MTSGVGSPPAAGQVEVRAEIGYGALLGLAIAALVAVPGAVRVSGAGQALALGWLGLFGAGALLVGPLVALGRLSRGFQRGWLINLLAVALAVPVWTVLGMVLKSGTHHRPLGAATYAFVSLMVFGGVLAVSARLATLLRSRRSVRLAAGAALASILLVVLKFAGPLAKSGGAAPLVDGALLLALALAACVVPPRKLGAVKLAGLLWVGVSALGLILFALMPGLRAAALAEAPLLAALAAWLVG